jgi:hypothetical protein
MNLAHRRGRDGVETNERTCRHHDLSAMLLCSLDKVFVIEKRTCAENDSDLPVCGKRRNDGPHELARGAFNHDVSDIGERLNRQKDRRPSQFAEASFVLIGMLRRNGRENQSIDSLVQRLNHPRSDGTQAGYRNPQVSS